MLHTPVTLPSLVVMTIFSAVRQPAFSKSLESVGDPYFYTKEKTDSKKTINGEYKS